MRIIMKDCNGKEIHINDTVIWFDPDLQFRDVTRFYNVDKINGDIVTISDRYSEIEVFSNEIEII